LDIQGTLHGSKSQGERNAELQPRVKALDLFEEQVLCHFFCLWEKFTWNALGFFCGPRHLLLTPSVGDCWHLTHSWHFHSVPRLMPNTAKLKFTMRV